MSTQQKMSLAQAFNIVAPAARGCVATGEQHDLIVSALMTLKEHLETLERAEKEAAESAKTLKAVEAPASV